MKSKKLFLILLAVFACFNFVSIAHAYSSVNILINGKKVNFTSDTGYPFVDKNNRTMVPLRAIGEALGKIVYYNDKYICISDIDLNMSDDSAISRKSTITSAKVPDKIEVVAINGTGQKYYPNQLDVFAVEASDNDGNVETGAVDLDINTRWSSYGKSTLTLDLGEEKDVSGVAIAMWKGSERIYPFTIEYSVDGKTWETALPKTQNTGESSEFEKYMFPETVKARYIRYNGDGATDPDKNYCHISEIAVLGAEE